MSFTIETTVGRVTRTDGAWDAESAPDLVALVDGEPAEPQPLTVTGPVLPVDWADEAWLFLHAFRSLEDFQPKVVEAPALPALPPLPAGVIA